MGGSSKNKNLSTSKSYKTTTTTNPYVSSTTTNKGTTTTLAQNTALSSIYNFTNNNMDRLQKEYLNPTIDSATNKAKMDLYTKTLNDETRKNLENNIITPLAERNMIRPTQDAELYKNIENQNKKSVDNYSLSLLSDSQNNTGNIINNLLNMIFQGYNVVSGNQMQSLNTSSGNATISGQGSASESRYKSGI